MLKLLKPLSVALAIIATQFIASAGELNFYSSGSTGVDGPFAPEVVNDVTGAKLQGSVPPGSRLFVGLDDSVKTFHIIVPLPQNGVFNFTTFNLPKGYVMIFDSQGTTNPGVVILATGDIVIGGMISVSARDALLASLSNPASLKDGQSVGSPIAGPGGFRGGLSGGFGANQFPLGPMDKDPRLTLPLTGGVGSYTPFQQNYLTEVSGGAGTLTLASSKRVIFEPNGAPDLAGGFYYFFYSSPAVFKWKNSPGNYGPGPVVWVPGAGVGSVAIFANETKGSLSTRYDRVLVCAFEQEDYFFPNSMSPPWPVGIRGADMPVNPAARFVEFAGKSLTAEGEPDRVILEKSGEYKLALETRNLPPGIVFVCTLRRLNPSNGSEIGKSGFNFPPTVATTAGACRAEMMIPITPGGTYITAIATKPIETVYSPIIHGEPLTEMVAQLDLQGGQTIHFKTASGRQVDAATARREALKQGKTRFPAFKS
jgi:hypothetical protein